MDEHEEARRDTGWPEGVGVEAIAVAIGDRLAEKLEERVTVMPTLTLQEAADQLDISPETLRGWCAKGKIPHIRVEKFYRIRPIDINRFLMKNYEG